jgi:Holliday junction DNA helicase RuvB
MLVEDEMANNRPQNFDEYIGQSGIMPVVKNAIRLSNEGKRLFPSTLLYGGPGLGKSSLVGVLAKETGLKLISYTGGKDLTGTRIKQDLLNLDIRGYADNGIWKPGATRYLMFFDEIHAAHSSLFDQLLEPIEDLQLTNFGSLYWLPDISFVFATTKPATLMQICRPFMDRLTLQLHLTPYNNGELEQIIKRLHPNMEADIIADIANRSCGVARLAVNYAQSVEDYPGGLEWFSIMGISPDGLQEGHRKYIQVLEDAGGRAVSLSALASVLRELPSVVSMWEEELLRQDRIVVTPHGRLLAAKGRGAKGHN